MKFGRAFVNLSLRFAQRVAAVKRVSLAEAILEYTHLYLMLGLARDFDPSHPVWQAYVAGLQTEPDRVAWTYEFYLRRQAELPKKAPEQPFGCFYYALWPENRVRLHFWNGEVGGESPLSAARQPQRMAELTAMLRQIKAQVPGTATLVGGSWLYNVEAYRRLFPPAYLATAVAEEPEYQFIALWGQFVDRQGEVRPARAEQFLARIATAATEADWAKCFPYQVLRLECPLQACYPFYGII